MKWITREKVKVDRVACPWLIRKFIDPEAVFVFVPAGEVTSKAAELGATMYDVEGCELGHHGEDVSFNSFLKRFNLTDPALELLGEIVRAADSHPAEPHPAGEGLRWVAHGFSVLGLSDAKILEREFVVYDALYAECQRRVSEQKNPLMPSKQLCRVETEKSGIWLKYWRFCLCVLGIIWRGDSE